MDSGVIMGLIATRSASTPAEAVLEQNRLITDLRIARAHDEAELRHLKEQLENQAKGA